MRKHKFALGEYYHIYNRGTEKRNIFLDLSDIKRFKQSLIEFNKLNPIGSIYELQFQKLGSPTTKLLVKSQKLVSIIAYCLNPNHFHLILTPLVENGIEKYMHRIGGYTRYFNEKNKRNGVLFQGRFKSKHIDSNEYLLHVSAYVNMNNRNRLGSPTTKLSESSLEEFLIKDKKGICDTQIILTQFKNPKEYKKFTLDSWEYTQQLREELEN